MYSLLKNELEHYSIFAANIFPPSMQSVSCFFFSLKGAEKESLARISRSFYIPEAS